MSSVVTHAVCRCRRLVRVTKAGKLYQHNVLPEDSFFGLHCPYSGVTREDAGNKITHLARRMLDLGFIKDPETGKWRKPE